MFRNRQTVSVFETGLDPDSEHTPVMQLTRRELIDVTRQQGIVFSRHDIRGGKAQLNPAAIHVILQSGFISSLGHSRAVSAETHISDMHDYTAAPAPSTPATGKRSLVDVCRVADDTLELPPLKATYSKPIGPRLPTKRQWRKMAYETVYVDLVDFVPQAEAVPEESNLRRVGRAAATGLVIAGYAIGPAWAAASAYTHDQPADAFGKNLYDTYESAVEHGISLLPASVGRFYQK